jgi:hypothetical protein
MPDDHTHPNGADLASVPALYTVAMLVRAEPALTRGGIRDDLFHRRSNGLESSGAVVYRGRRILLDRAKYLAWLSARSGRRAA